MRWTSVFVVLAACVVAVSAHKRGPKVNKPMVGPPLNQAAHDLHHNGGPRFHDSHGKTEVKRNQKHRRDPPKNPRLFVFLLHEQNQLDVKRYMHHSGCDFSKIGHWDDSGIEPINFVVNPSNSGMNVVDVERTFEYAASVIKAAVPQLQRRITFTHLPAGHEMTPSLHKHENITKIANKINEISFSDRVITDDEFIWKSGELVRNTYTGNVILEVHVLLEPNTDRIMEVDINFSNNRNVDWYHFNEPPGKDTAMNHVMLYGSRFFDACGSAIWALGHALGLGHTNSHTHTMHGVQARGTMHKRSLECGDINGLRDIYRK